MRMIGITSYQTTFQILFTDMARDPKSYGVKVAIIPMSVIDASVWGPNINNGDKSHTRGRVWQTFRFLR